MKRAFLVILPTTCYLGYYGPKWISSTNTNDVILGILCGVTMAFALFMLGKDLFRKNS